MRRILAFLALALAGLLAGCATTTFMPSSNESTVGDVTWKNYSEAQYFFDQIEPGSSTIGVLSSRGLDLKTSKNVVVLDRTSLLALFMANVPGSFEYIDNAVKRCLQPGENCTPYIFRKSELKEEGKGSLALRLLNFKKESVVHGWSVEMLLLIHDGVVVYKQIKGTPNGTELYKEETHPLGPLDVWKSGGIGH